MYRGQNVLILALFQLSLLNFKTTEECQESSEKPHMAVPYIHQLGQRWRWRPPSPSAHLHEGQPWLLTQPREHDSRRLPPATHPDPSYRETARTDLVPACCAVCVPVSSVVRNITCGLSW